MIFPHEEYQAFAEDIEKRTRHSKTFDVGNGKKKLVCSRSPIHHEKDGAMVDIDLTPKQTATGYIINGPEWDCVVEGANFTFTAHDGRTFSAESLDSPNLSRIALKGKGIEIAEAWPGVDLYLCVRPRGVEWYKRIKSADAKCSFLWKTPKESNLVHRREPEGRDAKGYKTLLQHDKVERINHAEVTETFLKRVAKRDPVTRVATSSDDVTYPVFIDVPDVSVSVGAGGDDAQQFTGYGVQASNAANEIGYSSSLSFKAVNLGVRFGGINVPQGATILSAALKVRQIKGIGNAQAQIYGVDVDNLGASPWTTIPGKPRTTAKSPWVTVTNTAFALNTHPITGVVQEVINRAGWASGNGLGLVGINTGLSPFNFSFIAAYESATEDAPLLEIDYDDGGGGGPVIPIFYHHYHQQGMA